MDSQVSREGSCEQMSRRLLLPGLLTPVCSQQQTGDAGEGGGAPVQTRSPSVSIEHALYIQSALCKAFLDLNKDVRHTLVVSNAHI